MPGASGSYDDSGATGPTIPPVNSPGSVLDWLTGSGQTSSSDETQPGTNGPAVTTTQPSGTTNFQATSNPETPGLLDFNLLGNPDSLIPNPPKLPSAPSLIVGVLIVVGLIVAIYAFSKGAGEGVVARA